MIVIRRCLRRFPPRYKVSLVPRKLSVLKDITGSKYSSSATSISDDLDECIIDIISHNNFAGPTLTKISSKHRCAFAQILLIYETLRFSDASRWDSLLYEFTHLESLFISDKLSKREALLAAGALQWYLGNYNKAGALLETILIESPGDVLAVALSQDAYMTGGSAVDVLGCAIRHDSPFHTKGHLRGYLQGILTAGYVETGRLEMAEELGQQAVNVTRGESIWAIHSLLNGYQLAGKSSDMLSKLNEFQPKHDNENNMCTGTINLLYNRGCAQIMRGSYIAAFNALDSIVSYLSTDESTSPNATDESTDVDAVDRAVSSVVTWRSAVLLLWRMELAMADHNVPSIFDPIWVYLGRSGHCTSIPTLGHLAMHDACVAIALTYAARADVKTVTKNLITGGGGGEVDTSVSNPSRSWWSQVVGGGRTVSGAEGVVSNGGGSELSTYDDLRSTILSNYGFNDEQSASLSLNDIKAKLLVLTTINDSTLYSIAKKMTTHGSINLHENDVPLIGQNVVEPKYMADSFCPKLRSIQPLIPRVTCRDNRSGQSALSDAEWSYFHSSGPLLKAQSLYHAEEYGLSSVMFAGIIGHSHLLGGTAVQRETLRNMLVDVLLRDKKIDSAKMLLVERSVLVPSDAQCWSQLSRVYRLLDQHDRAEQAYYTSWQLGIGQGGFGGFK